MCVRVCLYVCVWAYARNDGGLAGVSVRKGLCAAACDR